METIIHQPNPTIKNNNIGSSTPTIKSLNHFSLSLSPFLHMESLALISPPQCHSSHNILDHDLFEKSLTLTVEDHFSRRSSLVSPESRLSSFSLYPLPPHLTPHHSPVHTRPSSPNSYHHHSSWEHPDHNLQTSSVLGTLTLTVIEARGLAVEGNEKPYVLLQYDRTESISREFGAEEVETLKKKKFGSVKGGTGTIQQAKGAAAVSVRRVGSIKSQRVVSQEPPTGDPSIIGTPGAPVWNHKASFDVIQPGRTILMCIYDKLAKIGSPTNGFLGACVFEPDLIEDVGDEGTGFEIWVPLKSALDDLDDLGEVRLRILFEAAKTTPKLCVDDFQILRRIGEGSFGQVFRVRKRDTKRIYAMKVISKKTVKSSSALTQVLAERQVLARTLDSPFLVGLKFSFQSSTELFFVIDYKSGGELFMHLERNGGRFEEEKVRFYLCEIILALSYLHSQNIIYRDLKPENCLLDGSGHIVLVDFGLSKLLGSGEELTKTMCGTTAFMAPEVLLDIGYNFLADWWSAGVLCYEMLFGFSPFYAETRVEEYERILGGEIKIPTRRGHSAEARDLISRLLERSPEIRIGAKGGADEIKAHSFFSSIDWEKCALRQLAPPFKPPVPADLDACDYHDVGRSGDWMFSENGCYQTQSTRTSMISGIVPPVSDQPDFDSEGVFKGFAFAAKLEVEIEKKLLSSQQAGRRSSWNGKAP